MFAGKSSELIARLNRLAAQGQRVVAIRPSFDTRYETGFISTHDGGTFPALAISGAEDLPTAAGDAEVIGIDEAHFFGPALAPPCRRLIDTGRTLIIAGIERDHRGNPFPPFPDLLCEADAVTKLTSRCAVCGGPAVHSQRMFESAASIAVGGIGDYQARCRSCFRPPPS